jgi:predicted amidohydrolase YtcJ
MKRTLFIFLFLAGYFFLDSCSMKENADAIFYNGKIYTVDSAFSIVESFAVKGGKIVGVGTNEEIVYRFSSKNKIDLNRHVVFPGFYDAHCHFFGYGSDLVKCNLVGTKSFDEVIEKAVAYSKTNNFEWLLGRGWDQNDWEKKEFPDNRKLDSLFPDKPVYLLRIDGHAVLCNSKALEKAHITPATKVSGGIVETKNGRLTGILVDNAIDLVKEVIPAFDEDMNRKAFLNAQRDCFAAGLTSVCDAGLERDTIDLIEKMQSEGTLKMRINAMVSDGEKNLTYYFGRRPIKTDRLHVTSVKVYADGALGSRGACLLQDYSDRKGQRGFMLHDNAYITEVARRCYEFGFQLNTHCIGDSAVRNLLKIYGDVLQGKNDRRWRIEHCQVVHPDDLPLFGKYNIIPSVQPTHATSDMYWAEERLGPERIKTAYAFNDLMKQNGLIAFGTDFPVENINPLYTFYAAVARKDLKGFPAGGFQPENKVSRKDALRAMTTWAAFACFEEKEKGMIAPGMFADFIILSDDLMTASEEKIPLIKVLATYLSGEKVFEK